MPRALWKGAITFGLVHIPVGLYPAASDDGIDFDWLDSRSMDPVGYQRVNKRTGKEVERDHIVKGVAYAPGRYVVLSEQEIRDAYPKTTQTIEIEAFVDAHEVAPIYLDKPYWLAPSGRGSEKVYTLLRESLLEAGRIAIARVVIQTRQHLAAVIPRGDVLVLNTLRWANEIRSYEDLDVPGSGSKAARLTTAERKMAAQLIESMVVDWNPAQYRDRFRDAVMALVERKAESGDLESVQPVESLEEAPKAGRSNVIDLTELLRRSLGNADRGAATAAKGAAKRGVAKQGAAKNGAEKTTRRSSPRTAASARRKSA